MKVKDIANLLEEVAPLSKALNFDNSGLNVGDYEAEVTGIVVAVDVTKECIDFAIHKGYNLIVSHHPIIFVPLQNLINGVNYESDIVLYAISKHINLYSCHTNMDNADNGINYQLANRLNGNNITQLMEDGSGVCFDIVPLKAKTLLEKVTCLVTDHCTLYGRDSMVKRVGIISGCGGRDTQILQICQDKNIDIYISAEFKHNIILELNYFGIGVIEFNHYHSEKIFLDIINEILISKLNNYLAIDLFYCDIFKNNFKEGCMNLQSLLDYQKVDNELYVLEMQVKNSKEQKDIQGYSDLRKKSIEDLNKNLRDIEEALGHVERYNQAYAKTNSEIESLIDVLGDFEELREIDKYEKLIAQQQKELISIEKELYKLSNVIDESEKVCKQSVTNYAKCNMIIKEKKAIVDTMMTSMKETVMGIKGRMKVLKQDIPSDVLEKYNIARKSNRMPVLVPFDGNNCTGCMMDLPSSITNKIEENTFIECPNCGRLLYKIN